MVIRGTDSIHSDFQNGSVKYEPFGMLILWANWNEVLEQIKESSWKWANLGHQEDLSLHSIWCPWAKFRSLVSTLLDLALICLDFPGKSDQCDFLGEDQAEETRMILQKWIVHLSRGYRIEIFFLSPRAKQNDVFYLSPLVVHLSSGWIIVSLVISKEGDSFSMSISQMRWGFLFVSTGCIFVSWL